MTPEPTPLTDYVLKYGNLRDWRSLRCLLEVYEQQYRLRWEDELIGIAVTQCRSVDREILDIVRHQKGEIAIARRCIQLWQRLLPL